MLVRIVARILFMRTYDDLIAGAIRMVLAVDAVDAGAFSAR
jgi:hypothetical protein